MIHIRTLPAQLRLAGLLLLLVTMLAACGDNPTVTPAAPTAATVPTVPAAGSDAAPTAAAGGGIPVTLSEWAITPAALEAPAGHQTFKVTNTGKFPHNFTIVVGDKTMATPNVKAGDSATLETDLPAGTYDTLCSIPGHKDKGMAGKLTVK